MLTVTQNHRYRNPSSGLYYAGADVNVPVLVIEYGSAGGRTVPFTVITARNWWAVEWCQRDGQCYYHDVGSGLWLPWREYNGGSVTFNLGKGEAVRKRSKDRSQRVAFFGQAIYHPLPMTDRNAGQPVWWDRRFVLIGDGQGRARAEGKPVAGPDGYLRSLGYAPLAEPLDLGAGVINPFETDDFQSFGDTPCHYCQVCNDYLPSLDSGCLCDHLWWCEEHGDLCGPGAVDGCCDGSESGDEDEDEELEG